MVNVRYVVKKHAGLIFLDVLIAPIVLEERGEKQQSLNIRRRGLDIKSMG